jgi:hypothetical protein
MLCIEIDLLGFLTVLPEPSGENLTSATCVECPWRLLLLNNIFEVCDAWGYIRIPTES